MIWLQPLAWWGLAAVAVPVLIHLLARQRARRLPFPSLRFLRVSPMTALKTRVVTDWPLLALRVLTIVAATAALAVPVFVSAARRAAWNERIARAIVLPSNSDDAAARVAAEEARGSFVSTLFRTTLLADGIREGVEWLEQQPPAARELVIVGDFHEGAVVDGDLQVIPPFVGVRLLPVPGEPILKPNEARASAAGPDGRAVVYTYDVNADDTRTRVRYQVRQRVDTSPIRMMASPEEQSHADAILRALLREGVWLPGDERRVTIGFRGASTVDANGGAPSESWMQRTLEQNPEVRGGLSDGALVVRINLPATDPAAAAIASRVIRSAFATPFEAAEPRRIAASTLARWSRPVGPSPVNARPADEGDRRWFWIVVLALLALEHVVRRRRRAVTDADATAVAEDARVA